MYPSKYDRLRSGMPEGYMTYEIFRLLLREHAHGPEVRLFVWRGGPADRVTIYDYAHPRRVEERDPDTIIGWSEEDWTLNSLICNVPNTWMPRHSNGRIPGYLDRLQELLREGCFLPSRCLDEWLKESSARYCSYTPHRLRYRVN